MSSMLGTESPIEFQFVLFAYSLTALGFFCLIPSAHVTVILALTKSEHSRSPKRRT